MNLRCSQLYIDDLHRVLDKGILDFLKNKKLLITGGTGLIGSAVVDLCIEANIYQKSNITVYLAVRDKEKAKKRFEDGVGLVAIDYDALKPFKFNEKVDYILHCASNASPTLYIEHAVETMCINFQGLNSILEYAAKYKNCRVVYVSSSEIYGKKAVDEPFVENDYGYIDLLNERSSYSNSKRTCETLCKAYCSEYGVDSVIVRPGHVYGPSAAEIDERVSSIFAYRAAKGENLNLKSSGLQLRSYMYSIDCASAIFKVMEVGKIAEAYNICNDEIISLKDMALYLAKAGNVKLNYKQPTREEITAFNPMNNSSLNGMKLKKLGYVPCFSVREGLNHTVKILRTLICKP